MAAIGAGALTFGPGFWSQALALDVRGGRGRPSRFGPLQAPDANGVRLPAGFTSRVVATSGRPVGMTGYTWHAAPDGGACFALDDGGWVYVSNSEVRTTGGAGMLRFDARGNVRDAGRILSNTNRNCAGGPTPWGTWLSCEETDLGQVFECDPLGRTPARLRPGLGRFNHEAAAVDPHGHAVYLTEDKADGGLYRFVPTNWPDLGDGSLEVLTAGATTDLQWQPVPDPTATTGPIRRQVPGIVRFNRGEGAWFDRGVLYLATTGDNRIWTYRPATNTLDVLYDYSTSTNPILTGVDNVTVSRTGDVYVAEDGGDLQLVVLSRNAEPEPFLQIVGHPGSEIAGPAFSPDGTRLYVSSQRPGVTYEIRGPFLGPGPSATT
jgi:uncharacterized protein